MLSKRGYRLQVVGQLVTSLVTLFFLLFSYTYFFKVTSYKKYRETLYKNAL